MWKEKVRAGDSFVWWRRLLQKGKTTTTRRVWWKFPYQENNRKSDKKGKKREKRLDGNDSATAIHIRLVFSRPPIYLFPSSSSSSSSSSSHSTRRRTGTTGHWPVSFLPINQLALRPEKMEISSISLFLWNILLRQCLSPGPPTTTLYTWHVAVVSLRRRKNIEKQKKKNQSKETSLFFLPLPLSLVRQGRCNARYGLLKHPHEKSVSLALSSSIAAPPTSYRPHPYHSISCLRDERLKPEIGRQQTKGLRGKRERERERRDKCVRVGGKGEIIGGRRLFEQRQAGGPPSHQETKFRPLGLMWSVYCAKVRARAIPPAPSIWRLVLSSQRQKRRRTEKRRRKWWTPCWSASSPCWHWDWLVPRQRRLCRNYWITARFLSRLHLLRLPYSPISPGWPYQLLLLLLLLYRPVTLCRPATNRLAASSFRPPGNPSNSICLSV